MLNYHWFARERVRMVRSILQCVHLAVLNPTDESSPVFPPWFVTVENTESSGRLKPTTWFAIPYSVIQFEYIIIL